MRPRSGERAEPRSGERGEPRSGERGETWSGERAESHLRSLELFGMRFGLDRMRRMMTALGSPEREFASIHVLGTNGKTSTARMTAAILEGHGVSTGTYTSPHLVSYCERIEVGEREIASGAFAAAVARAARAAELVNRTLAEDDHVTQFELLTAAAFDELARRGVEVAVVEAGLGGRYDATSVVESAVTVLTGVGLEHTRWLGPTIADIAEEKLAVVPPGGTLVLGAGLHADALAVARRVAGEQGARIVEVGSEWAGPLLARGAFQRANFALAEAAAAAYLEGASRDRMRLGRRTEAVGPEVVGPGAVRPGAVRPDVVRAAALRTTTPGRMQVVGREPLVILDGAHNPDAVAALAGSLPELLAGRPLGLVMGVLEDKDAATMLDTLLAMSERAWFTAPPSGRALSPAALQSLARQRGVAGTVSEPDPRQALALAREWAGAHSGAVLATGSIYLVGELLGELAGATGEARETGVGA